MKKFILAFATIFGMYSANAESYVKPSIIDNTYLTVSYGITNLMHPRNNYYGNYVHSFAQQITLDFSKYITPHFGLAINGTLGWDTFSHVKQSGNTVSFVDVSLLGKYRFVNTNKFSLVAGAGPSWIHGMIVHNRDNNDLGIKMQLEFAYKVTNRLSLVAIPELNYNFTATSTVNPRHFQPYFNSNNAWYGLNVGASYRFGDTFKACPFKYTQEEVDALNDEINGLKKELEKGPRVITEHVINTIVKNVDNSYSVFFEQGKSDISDVSEIVKELKKTNDEIVIVGSTSPEGTEAFNRSLAQKRAEAVKKALVDAGISADRISTSNDYNKQRNATIFIKR